MPLSNEDAVAIAELVRKVVADEQEALVAELQEALGQLIQNVDETVQGLQQYVVARTEGIEAGDLLGEMERRVGEFWVRAIAANYVATKPKKVVDDATEDDTEEVIDDE